MGGYSAKSKRAPSESGPKTEPARPTGTNLLEVPTATGTAFSPRDLNLGIKKSGDNAQARYDNADIPIQNNPAAAEAPVAVETPGFFSRLRGGIKNIGSSIWSGIKSMGSGILYGLKWLFGRTPKQLLIKSIENHNFNAEIFQNMLPGPCDPEVIYKIVLNRINLRILGFTIPELFRAGFSLRDLSNTRFKKRDFNTAGITLQRLKDARIQAWILKAAGYSARDLKDAGYSARELKAAGFSLPKLVEAGFLVWELKDAGFSAEELKDAGFSLPKLVEAGFLVWGLKNAGFSFAELMGAGFKKRHFDIAWITLQKLKNAGFSARELKDASYSARDLKDAGYLAQELKDAGFDPTYVDNMYNGRKRTGPTSHSTSTDPDKAYFCVLYNTARALKDTNKDITTISSGFLKKVLTTYAEGLDESDRGKVETELIKVWSENRTLKGEPDYDKIQTVIGTWNTLS